MSKRFVTEGCFSQAQCSVWSCGTDFLIGDSSNINEIIKTVLNILFILWYDFLQTKSTKRIQSTKRYQRHKDSFKLFFFMIRFYTHKTTKRKQGTKKHSKYKNITTQKHKNAKKWKIKNVLKKHLSGKKSLIHLFV